MILAQNHQQPLSGSKKFVYFLILCEFCITACSPKTAPVQKTPVETTVLQPKVEQSTAKEQTVKPEVKLEMQISMLLPFDLDHVDYKTASLSDLNKSEIAIDFYQGFKMGLDSVAHQKGSINFKLNVIDSQDDPAKLAAIANRDDVKASDLIIGPIFPSGIKQFSIYAKNRKMPMVSPLAASDPANFNNSFLVSFNSSLDQHAFKAAEFVKTDLHPKKVILIRSGQADEYKYAVPFKKGMDSLAKGIPFTEIGIKAVGYPNIYKSLSPIGLNVIVLPATDRIFLLTILPELEKLKANYQIAVIGHPGWEKANFLNNNQLELLNTYITSSYQIDYKSSRVANFLKYYRAKYSLEPSEYAFKGFDIGYYLGNLMNKYGKDYFTEFKNLNADGIHSNFRFLKDDRYGYYNVGLMVMKYRFNELEIVKP
jgi:ABC-type branched-subunit amino acid transport system substrate-binding protein